MGLYNQKRKMAELISLNVLVVPRESTESITRRNIIVLKISPNDSVYQFKAYDQGTFAEEVEPTGIILRRADFEPWQNFDTQFDQYKRMGFPTVEKCIHMN